MRYAVLSDIHANLPALQRVLEEARKRGAQGFLCAGDVVGYGPQPNECCSLLQELEATVVRGNHDEAAAFPGKEQYFTAAARACIVWTREQLSAENLQFLEALEPFYRLPGAHLCHGSLADPDLYTTGPGEAALSFELMEAPLCFLGHTHYAEWYIMRDDGRLPSQHTRPEGGHLALNNNSRRHVINPGAVGQPRDGNSQASFAIWDDESGEATIHRVSYDVEVTMQRILDAGLPASMAERLRYGI